MTSLEDINKSFLDEYNAPETLLKYSTDTAGNGINYLVETEYGAIYDRAIAACRRTSSAPLRLLEYGCGAGMNLISVLSRLEKQGIQVKDAHGTDFSEALIQSAKREARAYLSPSGADKTSFHLARNEALSTGLAASMGTTAGSLYESFDLVIGVNTFRYCHRLNESLECATDIYRLLRPGGVSVMIDMNDRFPLFRSRLRAVTQSLAARSPEETYLPSLDEYAAPFHRAGLVVDEKRNFCWIPHSAGRGLVQVCRALTPVLNMTFGDRAMRSLVVAHRP